MISSGKVSVNGKVVREPGARIDPDRDHVAVDGKGIPKDVPLVYVALYKPKGYVTTREDPHATHTVMELIRGPLEQRLGKGHPAVEGLHPVGRLDTQTEGLLILTNDGAFTNALTHPRHQVPKRYRAQIKGIPTREALEQLRTGIPLFGRRTLPARVRVTRADRTKGTAIIEVELREGRNQQVRRMLQAVGYPVNDLMRVGVGTITLNRMKPGQWRFLTDAEIDYLIEAAAHPEEPLPDARSTPRKSRPLTGGRQRAAERAPAPGKGTPRPEKPAPSRKPKHPHGPPAKSSARPPRPGPRAK